MEDARAAWMFRDWPEKSFDRDRQRLSMAVLRLRVIALDRPAKRLVRWVDRRLAADRSE